MVRASSSTSASEALHPLRNSSRATGKDSSSRVSDRGGDIVEDDVLEEERAGEEGAFRGGGLEEDRGVGDGGIEDGLGADGLAWGRLLRATGVDFEADTAVVERDALEGPAPVPEGVDSGRGVVDGDVADGELLVTDPDTEFLEGDVC